jgi:uncharacterized protein YutE (UPF0331/DUF86 family)
MSPIDLEVIRRKLQTITPGLELLEPYRGLTLEGYRADVYRRKAAERILQEIVEPAADINAHILVGSGQPAPESVHASFLALGDLGVLDGSLAKSLAPSAGLRNRLVHQYDRIEDEKVLSAVRQSLDEYRLYVSAVQKHLDRV